MRTKQDFWHGVICGIPVALGYLSVSFGFGIMAVKSGLTVLQATLISLTNLTSAGQAAGVDVIASSGTLIEMALVQLAINIRYALMALSLSQNLSHEFTFPHRLLASYGITDEIFGVCIMQTEPLLPVYMYGVISISMIGWVTGTFLGAAAGTLLPGAITSALGIILYGMFLAIIIPPARKQKSILCVVLASALCSILCSYLLPQISGGFTVIICAVIASVLGALLFPREEEIT